MNVLVTTGFTDVLLDRMRAVSPDVRVTRDESARANYAEVDVLYGNTLPRDPARAPRLKWVQLHMAGPDSIHDHPIYTETGIALTTTSGVHAATVAEYAITVMLALAHRVPRMVEWKRKGGWPPDEQRWPLFVPTEVRGATLGLVGYGSIGRELARIAKTAFAMTVLACKRDLSERRDTGYCRPGTGDPEGRLPDAWFAPGQLYELLSRSDVVIMCAPLTRDTRHLFNAQAFDVMKPSTYFVNVGRGGSVDELALVSALKDGRIAGAAIDVFAQEPPPKRHPLYALDNVIVSPHVSGFLPSYDDACTDLFVENLRRYLAGAPLLNLVDRASGY
ncbi:MAG TPA: D-2-hydroxyacid dehydrogenase [Candidatus Methylomirabilis sp.]|nr:D-2-hydroxyacid dehydrogenase [Candidatus Methylomirabilis sp.]